MTAIEQVAVDEALALVLDLQPRLRVVPVILDDAPLPPILSRSAGSTCGNGDETRAVTEIMRFATDQDRLLAIQQHLDEAGIQVEC